MTTPAVRTIRRNFPDAEITLLALPWVADVFGASPRIDRLFLYEKNGRHQGLRGKLRLAGELKQQSYDLAILLQNAFEAAFITTWARIPARAGYTTDGRGLLLTHGVKKDPAIGTKHQVHYYQEMLAGLGLQPGADTLELFLDPDAVQRAGRLPAISRIDAGTPIIGLNPGAAFGPAKRWPAEKFGKLAQKLHEHTGATILVFGTDADREAAAVIQNMGGNNSVHDLTGKTDLALALALIDRCNVFVTNDSGLMHVAAALNTPLAAVFGSTDHVATGPYSKRAEVIRKPMDCSPCMKTHCPQEHFQCMEQISVKEVADTALRLLEKYFYSADRQ